MIKFFRHIRQKLLTENKFSKYLLYAMGEIILVVIGILMALQINNWNESRKDHAMGVTFLSGIKDDLKKDVHLVDSIVDLNKISLSIISSIDSVFHQKPYYETSKYSQFFVEPDTLDYNNVFYRSASFRPITGTYNSLIADGKTTLIKNKELLEKIQQIYNENHQRVDSNYGVLKDIETKLGWEYSVEKQQWSFMDLKLAKKEKIFYDLISFTEEKYWYCQNLLMIKENSLEVIERIEKEIEND